MKKILVLLFVSFISLFFHFKVSALVEPELVATITGCSFNGTNPSQFTFRTYSYDSQYYVIYVYSITDLDEDYNISVSSADGFLDSINTSTLYDTCITTSMGSRTSLNYTESSRLNIRSSDSPVVQTYHITQQYFYLYISQVGRPFSYSFVGSFTEPPAPLIDYEMSDDDFYLFFDFDSISGFNIFDDYDFTSFSDFEKLMFTVVINVFYLLFIGFCIYLFLKGFYKVISWLFR